MKITSVKCLVLRVPLERTHNFYSSQSRFPERNSCLVRIETDAGIIGWGEGGQYGPPEPVVACIEKVLAPLIIGRDPTEPVKLWDEMYNFTRDWGQKGTYIEAISAIDIACWDIFGKSVGLPVSKLLGGAFRDRVKTYATGCYYPDHIMEGDLKRNLAEIKDEVSKYRQGGFDFFKVKIGLLDIHEDAERIRVIREHLGDDVGIMVDANHSYTAAQALRMSRLMEPYNIIWFEEPVVPEDRDGYRRLRHESNIPIAGGEDEYTRYGFRDLIGGGCVDVAQPDLCCCGGLSAFVQILAIANAHSIAVIPHTWGSGIAIAASLQAIAITPPIPHTAKPIPGLNDPLVEFDRTFNPLRDELLVKSFQVVDGYVEIPSGPGLGVEIDEAVLQKYLIV